MALTVRLAIAIVACTLAVAAPGYGQNRKWSDPYQKGVKAFEAGKFGEAIDQLEKAVAAEPKAEANKLEEGVHRIDYFPYYYLGLAYSELEQFDKAQLNLNKARATLNRRQQARFDVADARIKVALDPKPAPRNAAFDSALRETEALVTGKQFDAAIKKFDQLRTMDAGEYGKAGLAARRESAVKGLSAQLLDEARASIQASRFKDALTKLQRAEELQPGQRPVSELVAELTKRDDDYQRLKTGAQADFTARNYESARGKLQQAQSVQPELFASDNLAARLTDVTKLAEKGTATPAGGGAPSTTAAAAATNSRTLVDEARALRKQGKYPEAATAYAKAAAADANNRDAIAGVDQATKYQRLRDQAMKSGANDRVNAQKALVDARGVDAARFDSEGLGKTLESLSASAEVAKIPGAAPAAAGDESQLALKNGLLALLKGDAQGSIAILEPAASRANAAPLHAYLGVAYATRALSAPKADDRASLREKAVRAFKLAQAAEPAYQLSSRIVSPAILSIYQSARR